jgi:predicted transcriptional regulator
MPNNESATTQPPIGTTQFPLDDFRAELADLFQTQSFVTTTDLAERLDCTTETARTKLAELTNEGVLDARKVGAKAKVWSPSTFELSPLEVSASGRYLC